MTSERARSGWTGGQYSVLRALCAFAFAWRFGAEVAASASGGAWSLGIELGAAPLVDSGVRYVPGLVAAVALPFVLALALGAFDRIAASVLVLLGAFVMSEPRAWVAAALVLVLHVATAPKPYGAWGARGRVDPGGDWSLGPGVRGASWLAAIGASAWAAPELGAAWPWLALLWLRALYPAWLRGDAPGRRDLVFYDGGCGLCHRAVRFLLAEDETGERFAFAPLQGETFEATVPSERRRELPDSIVLRREDGELLVESSAIGAMLLRLGGWWRVVGSAVLALPRPLRDGCYRAVARVRRRIFREPETLCPMLPPRLGARFRA